ncbi:Fe-S oxidoreductase [Pseudomonas chlororaphis subsp. aurantiaca]|nr:Fe-S oxidoreductase [Pseudomonas chlororaphis subsp. aurantiaca]
MAKEIDNPCIAVCQLSGDLCLSCGRSKDDIHQWKRMKRPEKMAAVQRASQRLKALRKKGGASR